MKKKAMAQDVEPKILQMYLNMHKYEVQQAGREIFSQEAWELPDKKDCIAWRFNSEIDKFTSQVQKSFYNDFMFPWFENWIRNVYLLSVIG